MTWGTGNPHRQFYSPLFVIIKGTGKNSIYKRQFCTAYSITMVVVSFNCRVDWLKFTEEQIDCPNA